VCVCVCVCILVSRADPGNKQMSSLKSLKAAYTSSVRLHTLVA
jgi:hypothetical protein